MFRRFRAFSLTIDSEIPLPGWPFLPEPKGEADIQFRLGKVPEGPPSEVPWQVVDGEVFLRLEGVGSFWARGGKEVVVEPVQGAGLGRLTWCLRSSMMAALMMQRGSFPLHASCVDSPEGAVLLMGFVGVGKSTLTALLHSRGFRVLCDDMAVVRSASGGDPEVLASTPTLGLWARTLRVYGVPPDNWGRPIVARVPKFLLPWKNWCGENRRPRAIVFLGQGMESEVRIDRLTPQAALNRLGSYLYRVRFLAQMPELAQPLRETMAALVRGATSLSLEYPKAVGRMPQACEALIDALASVPSRPREHWSQAVKLPEFEVHVEPTAPPPSGEGKRGMALLASYPKSGNTWVRSILTSWRLECEQDASLDYLDGGHPLIQRHYLDEVMAIDSDALEAKDFLAWRIRLHKLRAPFLAGPTPIKTHDMNWRGRDSQLLFPPETVAGVIYIVRNPLDVALSAANHFKLSVEDTVTMMGTPASWEECTFDWGDRVPEVQGSWSQHVTNWLDEPDNRCLVVRYEDMLADALTQLKRIREFLELPWDEERGRRAVEKNAFKNLKKIEEEKGFKERPLDVPSFFRKGEAGGWRNSLSSELARQIVEDHGEVMRRVGYGADVDEVLSRVPK